MTPFAHCPICFSTDHDVVWSTTSAAAAQHFVLEEQSPQRHHDLRSAIERLWQSTTAEVKECLGCSFVFSDPFISGDKDFYDLAFQRTGYPRWKWEFQRTLDRLEQIDRTRLHILEVGAGDGAFLSRVAERLGPGATITCTEYSDYGHRRLKQLGFDSSQKDIRTLMSPEHCGRFDVLALFQVLQSMDRLDELFSTLKRVLAADGSIFIAVTNRKKIDFNEKNGALLDMPPTHIGRWSRRSFEIIAARHGLCVAEHEIEPLSRKDAAIQLASYRTRRRSQTSGTLENSAFTLESGPVRAVALRLLAAKHLLQSAPLLRRLDASHGPSQWVHLRHQEAG